MKHLFIINPVAGKKENTQALEEQIRALGVDYEIVYTTGEGDAQRFAAAACESGEAIRIYACGGDGTLNEVVNGAAGHDHAAVTNVPMGSGNDYLKIFGPENKARFRDLAALAEGPQAVMDLVDCSGKLGIGSVCAGVDARIAADVHRFKALPLVRGLGAYIMSLLSNVLFKGICRPAVIDVGGDHYEGETTIICVCNGRYYGSGFMPVGDNMPDDGLFEVLTVPRIGILTFARLVGKYSKGKYRELPQYITYHQGTSLSFRSGDHRDMAAVVDGEVMYGREFTVTLSDKKVNFFYPADLNYLPR